MTGRMGEILQKDLLDKKDRCPGLNGQRCAGVALTGV